MANSLESQFYTDFIHCDVKKDHPRGYDANIVKGFLPDNSPEKSVDNPQKEALFNQLLTLVPEDGSGAYNFFQSAASNANGSVQVNLFDTHTYNYNVYDRTDSPESIQRIQGEMSSTIVKITDTSNHTDRIHKLWGQVKNPILQVRTREVQMDPATKIAPVESSVGNTDMFYVESKPPNNATHVVYPPYDVTNNSDKLTHFFCKYPVYVVYDGIKPDKYTLKVHLEYIKDGKTIMINGDSNKAGIIFNIINKAKQCFSLNIPDSRIESGYIGKHSGDILMVLSQFRNISLHQFNAHENTVSTENKYTIFESSDTNAINKAFAVGTDCIWLHTNNKERMIVFTKVTNQKDYVFKRAITALKTFLTKMSVLKDIIEAIDTKLSSVVATLEKFKVYSIKGSTYVDVLKEYTQYAVLYNRLKSIEKRASELEEKSGSARNIYNTAVKTLKEKNWTLNSSIDTVELSNEIFTTLEAYDRQLSPYLCLDIDIVWANTLLVGESLAKINIDEVTVLSSENARKYEDVIKYEDIFKCVNLEVPSSEVSRRISVTKTISSWGIDIIHMTYDILKKIDEDSVSSARDSSGGASSTGGNKRVNSEDFITKLYNVVPDEKKKKFVELIASLNIKFEQRGGSRLYGKTYKKSKKRVRKTSKLYKQFGGALDKGEFIEEIVENIRFMINTLNKESSQEEAEVFKQAFEEINAVSASSASVSSASSASASTPSVVEESVATVILDPISTYELIAETLNSAEIKDALEELLSPKEENQPNTQSNVQSIEPTPKRKVTDSMGTERTETQERAFTQGRETQELTQQPLDSEYMDDTQGQALTQGRLDSEYMDDTPGKSLGLAMLNASSSAPESNNEAISPPPKITRSSLPGFAPAPDIPIFGEGVLARQGSPITVNSLSSTSSSPALAGRKRGRSVNNKPNRSSNQRRTSKLRANKRK